MKTKIFKLELIDKYENEEEEFYSSLEIVVARILELHSDGFNYEKWTITEIEVD